MDGSSSLFSWVATVSVTSRVAVVLTDGNSNVQSDRTVPEAIALHQAGSPCSLLLLRRLVNNKPVFTADNAAEPAFAAVRRPCSSRSISPAHRACSNKAAAATCNGRTMGQTDRQTDGRTDGRTLSRYIAPTPQCQRNIEQSLLT